MGFGEEDFEGFLQLWAWRPSWSFDSDAANKPSSPLTKEALTGQAVFEKKMFEHCERRTNAGSWVYYKFTYEPLA